MPRALRNLHFKVAAAKGSLQKAQLQGRDYLVVPVIALREGIVRPSTSDKAELVTIAALEGTSKIWGGKPVVQGHPPVSQMIAGTPEFLSSNGLGTMFNSHMVDDKLCIDAWIDLNSKTLNDAGKETISRLESGEEISVSIGGFVDFVEKEGTFNGQDYEIVWNMIYPDHLAFLPEGTDGACSTEMGCGAPLQASASFLQATPGEEQAQEGWFTKLMARLSKAKTRLEREKALAIVGLEMSDVDTRDGLYEALGEMGDPYAYIACVYPDSKTFVYQSSNGKMYKRSYSVGPEDDNDGTGEITLSADAQEVYPVTTFEPVNNKAAEQEDPMTTKVTQASAQSQECKCTLERATKLAEKLGLEGEEAIKNIMTWPPAMLERMEVVKKSDGVDPAEAVIHPAKSEGSQLEGQQAKPATLDQYIASAPAEIQEVLSQGVKMRQAKKAQLITQLKGVKGNPYSETELNAMSLDGLEKLAKLAGQNVSYALSAGETSPAMANLEDQMAPVPASIWDLKPKTASQANTKTA